MQKFARGRLAEKKICVSKLSSQPLLPPLFVRFNHFNASNNLVASLTKHQNIKLINCQQDIP